MDRVGDLVDVVRNRDGAPGPDSGNGADGALVGTSPRPDGAPGPGDGDDLALEVLERARTRAGKPAS